MCGDGLLWGCTLRAAISRADWNALTWGVSVGREILFTHPPMAPVNVSRSFECLLANVIEREFAALRHAKRYHGFKLQGLDRSSLARGV